MRYKVKTASKLWHPTEKRTKIKCPYCHKIHSNPALDIKASTAGYLTCPNCKKVYEIKAGDEGEYPTVKTIKKV